MSRLTGSPPDLVPDNYSSWAKLAASKDQALVRSNSGPFSISLPVPSMIINNNVYQSAIHLFYLNH